jgi:hypothetical protein
MTLIYIVIASDVNFTRWWWLWQGYASHAVYGSRPYDTHSELLTREAGCSRHTMHARGTSAGDQLSRIRPAQVPC